MGAIECSQLASKSSWDSQDFGDNSMVLKMAHFRKSTGPRWVNYRCICVCVCSSEGCNSQSFSSGIPVWGSFN